jgi:hypothetical protein
MKLIEEGNDSTKTRLVYLFVLVIVRSVGRKEERLMWIARLTISVASG